MDPFIYPILTKTMFSNVFNHRIMITWKLSLIFYMFWWCPVATLLFQTLLHDFSIFISVRLVQSCAFLSYPSECRPWTV